MKHRMVAHLKIWQKMRSWLPLREKNKGRPRLVDGLIKRNKAKPAPTDSPAARGKGLPAPEDGLCGFEKGLHLPPHRGSRRCNDSLAQQVEHIPFKDGVLGSSPRRITCFVR